jgi:hypothetical protein
MSTSSDELVITIDAKRLIAITLLTIVTFTTLFTYTVALFAWIANDSTDYMIDVTSEGTFTTSNVASTSFARGAKVRVKATVEKAVGYYTTSPAYTSISGGTPSRIIIIAYRTTGGEKTFLHFYSTTATLYPAQPQTFSTDFTVPSDATQDSNYYVKVMVWDEWLPTGETLQDPTATISPLTATQFTVT